MNLIQKLFAGSSAKEIKRIMPLIEKINSLSDEYSALSEQELKDKTRIFKEKLQNGSTLDDILPEAFAAVREASGRVLGMRHFDVQLMGGIILHQGRIAEMKTGEGKTLMATLPAYLNALSGNGVHIITVNDYLAKRDSEWMGKVYKYMGLSVGLCVHGMSPEEKQAAYNADITYGTNNEFGFDYLRDNMVIYKENMVQRGHNFAIVDEVDSILIDEARTPLIISGAAEKSSEMYQKADIFAKGLSKEVIAELNDKESYETLNCDYVVDEKAKTATLLKSGIEKAERFFGIENLSDSENVEISHHINQALKAHGIMHRDVDYVVRDGKVIIVDEFTGRLMFGRRYSQGLHQAIEAKEHVKVENESKTLATITFQNYFRLYSKLSGMTGTALTEQEEFQHIYNLDVVEIPTNKPMIRQDLPDAVYKTEAAKFGAVIKQIEECHAKGQPVLCGTISIEKSELLSSLLRKKGIKHEVLNAKYHEKEAEIIAQAGKKGAVTIATNMAGRGTDIILGGNAEYKAKSELRQLGYSEELINECDSHSDTENAAIIEIREKFASLCEKYKQMTLAESEEVRNAGGLFIIGTERHESRRIDNQLRGRAGRQGDPGSSRFYISADDEVTRLFAGERIRSIMNTFNMPDDMPLESKALSSVIEQAQRKVEGINFQRRKSVLEYDDVMNQQREIIYGERKRVLSGENLKETILKMASELISSAAEQLAHSAEYAEDWDLSILLSSFGGVFLKEEDLAFSEDEKRRMTKDDIISFLTEKAEAKYALQESENTPEIMREAERVILLRAVDLNWMDHIDAMDSLREGIGLRAYAQRDPIVEYRLESFDMFEQMINEIKEKTVTGVLTVKVRKDAELKREKVARETGESGADDGSLSKTVRVGKKPGRNDPCPCGSGLKYKKCCGKDE